MSTEVKAETAQINKSKDAEESDELRRQREWALARLAELEGSNTAELMRENAKLTDELQLERAKFNLAREKVVELKLERDSLDAQLTEVAARLAYLEGSNTDDLLRTNAKLDELLTEVTQTMDERTTELWQARRELKALRQSKGAPLKPVVDAGVQLFKAIKGLWGSK
jgi:chromosome segregation ATPase